MAVEHKYDYGGIVMKKGTPAFQQRLLKSRGFFCEKFRGNFLQFVKSYAMFMAVLPVPR